MIGCVPPDEVECNLASTLGEEGGKGRHAAQYPSATGCTNGKKILELNSTTIENFNFILPLPWILDKGDLIMHKLAKKNKSKLQFCDLEKVCDNDVIDHFFQLKQTGDVLKANHKKSRRFSDAIV